MCVTQIDSSNPQLTPCTVESQAKKCANWLTSLRLLAAGPEREKSERPSTTCSSSFLFPTNPAIVRESGLIPRESTPSIIARIERLLAELRSAAVDAPPAGGDFASRGAEGDRSMGRVSRYSLACGRFGEFGWFALAASYTDLCRKDAVGYVLSVACRWEDIPSSG
jgi:hypothetical protein